MREDIVSFVRDEGKQYPFYLEMTGISYCDGTYRIARANSPITVVEYVISGRGAVMSDGRAFGAAAGDVYMLHRGSTHWYASDAADPWVKIWANVGGPVADSLMADYGLAGVNHVPQAEGVRPLFEKLLESARAWRGDAGGFFRQAAPALHGIVARIHAAHSRGGEAVQPEANALKRWLDGHVYEKASIRDFAAEIYRSPSQAIRIFKRAYGVTPYDYLLGRRMETAKLLLSSTGLPVKEIAFRLDFADEHYFSNFFKKRTGVSPREYRGR